MSHGLRLKYSKYKKDLKLYRRGVKIDGKKGSIFNGNLQTMRFMKTEGKFKLIIYKLFRLIKNIKIDNSKIIKTYFFILLSLLIIFYGASMVYKANQHQIRSNIIEIQPQLAKEGQIVILDDNKIQEILTYNFSDREKFNYLPFKIQIFIDYKEPVIRDNYLNINSICTTVRGNPDKNNIHKYDIKLNLSGSESLIKTTKFEQPQLIQKNLGNYYVGEDIEYFPGGGYLVTIKPLVFCEPYEGESLILIEPDSNGKFEFLYTLFIIEEGKSFTLTGNASLAVPIKCADKVEELNIRTNERILILTGYLIILGSFPFSLALRNLLFKD